MERMNKNDVIALLEEVTEEYQKECQYNSYVSNRCFELKGAKEILEHILEDFYYE